jgi:hypothetical protein
MIAGVGYRAWFGGWSSLVINNTCKAAYYHLTNIRRIRKYLDENAARKLIHALIIGRIDYCNGILYGLPATQIIKLQLQRLQNAAARLVLNILLYAHFIGCQ